MIRVCSTEDVPKGSAIAAMVDGTPLAIVHAPGSDEGAAGDGEFFAVYDQCSHEAVALSEGDIDGCQLECWLHGSRFDLRTGAPTGLPATRPVPVYPVEIRDGDVYVSLTPSNGVTAP
ncbi:MAG TPA: non-heme iron oxygenase ferredoxin subunit [Micromonosporaceae bacterium]|nr:non-heme iron oxygenase ferredoxin subunit [Micromonosporaceae bacterium]